MNVGACTGSYEPPDRHVLAVEPRRSSFRSASRRAPCLAGSAATCRSMTSPSNAAMLSTPSHCRTRSPACARMRRVCSRVVVFTFDAVTHGGQFRADFVTPARVRGPHIGRPSRTEHARGDRATDWNRCSSRGPARRFFEATAPARGMPGRDVRRGISVWARSRADIEQAAVHRARTASV